MNDVRGSCRHLGSRVSGTTNVSGGVSRDSKASSDGVRITRSNGGLRSMTYCRVHTKPDEVTSERNPIGADIRREKRPEQHENDDRSGNGGFDIREVRVGDSAWLRLEIRGTVRPCDGRRPFTTTHGSTKGVAYASPTWGVHRRG